MSARSYPANPVFTNDAEKVVFEALLANLSNNSEIFCNYKYFDGEITREVDFIVLSPGHGVIFIEVKGGLVTLDAEGNWHTTSRVIDPHKQVTNAMYQIRDLIESEWQRNYRPVFAWLLAFPQCYVDGAIETQTVPRDRIVDEIELPNIRDRINQILRNTQQATNSTQDLQEISTILRNNRDENLIYQDQWEAIQNYRDRLTESQQSVLDMAEELDQYIVTGPAGSGKTFLALEQARRHTLNGKDTALICYNVGLANFLRKTVSGWPIAERPKYVGTFHGLLEEKWQVDHPRTTDREYWNTKCIEKARANFSNRNLPRFDAFVVDEAQDFQYEWWLLLTLGFKEAHEPAYISAFGDIDQNIFPADSERRFDFPRLKLKKNLRSTTQIVECASALLGTVIEHTDLPGPSVRFVEATAEAAQDVADEVIETLLFDPFKPERLMLLTTNHRHPEHKNRLEHRERYGYWESYHEEDEVFYSHVSTFKGLERGAVVVAVDGWKDPETAREALYVAITRARDALVIVGDLADIRMRFGDVFANFLDERRW